MTDNMKWRTVVYLTTFIVSSFTHFNDAADAQQHNIQASDDSSQSRVRRSSLSWPYRPRVVRGLSSADIDEFNAGLHSKRPKFIGKRRVPSLPSSCHLDALGHCVTDADGGLPLDKRRRKFLGKKSTLVGPASSADETRSPKLSDKRGPRKFMGRRAYYPYYDRMEFKRLGRQVAKGVMSKRARRKFVG